MSGFSITRRDVDHMIDFMKEAQGRALNYRKPAENAMGVLGSQAESGLAAFGYGVVEGAFGPVSLGPVPADLAGAFLLHLGGLFGLFGGAAGHAHNFAQGLADASLHRLGIGMGARWAQKPKAATAGTNARGGYHISGTNPRGRYDAVAGRASIKPMTEAEIAAHVNAIR